MVVVGKEFIPHQLALSQGQMNKLIEGKPVNIPHRTMGSGAGDVVIHLKPQNARKLLTAYKKGKGMRLTMHPHEVEASLKHGRGFFSSLKKGLKTVGKKIYDVGKEVLKSPIAKQIGKDVIQHGSEAIGTAIGAYTGNPVVGSMIGHSLGKAGADAIDKGGVHHGIKSLKHDAHAVALEALDQNIQKLPPAYRHSAELALAGEYPQAVSNIIEHEYGSFKDTGGYGVRKGRGRPKKGSAEMKEKMAKLRAMKKSGGKIDIGKAFRNAFDPKKNGVAKAFDPKQNGVANAFNKTFTPELGRQIVSGLESAGKQTASALIHAGIPALAGVAGDLLTAGNPLGGVAGSVAGDMLANQIGKATGYGVRRGRGRPRKVGGDVASMSAPYKQALRMNYGGLTLNNEAVANASVSNFAINPRVKPSSTEMTLSPYARMDSPAMNPFIPTNYKQMGGTSCGYGGKGLYGTGLYGTGLF